MFEPLIVELQSQIQYHRDRQVPIEQKLKRLRTIQTLALNSAKKVQFALEQIDPKHLNNFKEHLLSLFPSEVSNLEEKPEEESLNDTEHSESGDFESKSIDRKIKPKKTYFELTGKPDLRPTKYEDLTVNISYSSDNRAYVGFNDRKEAEKFRERLAFPSMIAKGEIMYMYEWEVKFYADLDYVKKLAKEKSDNFKQINPRVIYNHNDKIAYLGMTAKDRCDYYGQYLTDQLTVGEKYTVSNKPTFVKDYKYELRITEISLDDAIHLANFDLQQDPEHPDNAKLLADWRINKVREVTGAAPLPRTTPLKEIKIGDIVSLNSNKQQYKVLEVHEAHCEAICIYHLERPQLVNQRYHFREVYKVDLMDICIDPRFTQPH